MGLQTMLANAGNYRQANRSKIEYLVIHYTGNKGDTAKGNGAYFAREHVGTSAHYFVDEDNIVQSVRDKDIAWHCGTRTGYFHNRCRNTNSIGIEICMLAKSGTLRQGSIATAVKLTRQLMDKYHIPPKNVLRHYDVTHKCCPAPMVHDVTLWNRFKEMLEQKEGKDMYTVYRTVQEVPDWGKQCVRDLIEKGYLKGDGDGQLDLEHYMLRTLCINWRAGLYR